MNPKTLQYLMEHSDIGVTLNTYTHFKHEDGLKSRRLGNENGICTPIIPLFCKTVGLSTGLSSIKMNMICGERSSFGDFFTYVKLSV